MRVCECEGMCVSRQDLRSRVQAGSDERVQWIDCGFYLMPVTSSKLSQFGLSWHDVKVVDPLQSIYYATFSEARMPLQPGVITLESIEMSMTTGATPPAAQSSQTKEKRFPCSLSFSPNVFAYFFLFIYKWT